MPKIKWVGFQKWDKEYPEIPLPKDATEITSPDHYFLASLKYGIIPMLICFAALRGKRMLYGEFPLDRRFVIIGIVIGILLIPVHELLHAVCFPRGSIVYVGLSPEKLAAFAVCHTPITKKRFMVMSLMPVVLWLVPFALFLLFPITWKISAAICWPAAMIGVSVQVPIIWMCIAFANVFRMEHIYKAQTVAGIGLPSSYLRKISNWHKYRLYKTQTIGREQWTFKNCT